MKLENKRIVITGATSGIGLETLKLLQKFQGTKIIAAGRNFENMPTFDNVTNYKCDISEKENVDKLFQFSIESFGEIDVFFANAGFGYYEVMNKANWGQIENIYRTNVISPMYAYQKMVELYPEKYFTFLITASAVSYFAMPYYTLYSSTKFALQGFLDGIQYEKPKNATVTLVHPVATKTKFFTKSSNESLKEVWPSQTAETVARKIVKGIQKNKRRIIPSPIFSLGRFFPFIVKLVMKVQIKRPE